MANSAANSKTTTQTNFAQTNRAPAQQNNYQPHRTRYVGPLLSRANSTEVLQAQQKLLLESPAPYVSAHNWVIIDRKTQALQFGKCETV